MLKRPDGKSLKILVRGDCTSRRSIKLNGDLFESPPRLVQNEKAPFVLFLDALKGTTITKEELEAACDVASMSATLQHFYLGQAARSVLTEKDADLLMLDSYADMNFELWENERGAKLWVHPAHLRSRDEFHAKHKSLGRRSLEQSVDDAVSLIEAVRRNNPGIPVLFLNQQTDFYPKLDSRLEYYDLGRRVAERVSGAFFGGIEDKEALELADVGSCGPGKTLHFQGSTYRRMLERAFDAGLDVALGQAPTGGSPAKAVAENSDVDDAAEDLPELRGEVSVSFAAHSPTCVDACSATVDKAFGTYANYFSFDADSGADGSSNAPRFTPMLISFDELKDFDAWEASVKKFGKGARIRQKKKAIAAGCYVKPFPWRLFIPDIHEANTSKEIRSGGKIRQNLKLDRIAWRLSDQKVRGVLPRVPSPLANDVRRVRRQAGAHAGGIRGW